MNKKIIDSLDQILPDEQAKKRILNQVLESTERPNRLRVLLPSMMAVLVFVFLLYPMGLDPSNQQKTVRNIEQTVYYQGTCYQEAGLWNGDTAGLELLEESSQYLIGKKIYQYQDSIIFENEDTYIEYERCKGENK